MNDWNNAAYWMHERHLWFACGRCGYQKPDPGMEPVPSCINCGSDRWNVIGFRPFSQAEREAINHPAEHRHAGPKLMFGGRCTCGNTWPCMRLAEVSR